MKNIFKYILIYFCISGCSTNSGNASKSDRLDELQDKQATYIILSEAQSDGFIKVDGCDSLFHTGIWMAGGGGDYNDFTNAQDDDGRWWRTPDRVCLKNKLWNIAHEKEIEEGKEKYRTPDSHSSCSRDQIMAVLLAALSRRDLDLMGLTVDYFEKNKWKCGEHDGSLKGINRVSMNPAFKALILQVYNHLGGEYSVAQEIPQVYLPNRGYQAHLQALKILIRGITRGKLNKIELNTIKSMADKDQRNALFLAIRDKYDAEKNGNQDAAIDILLSSLFPSDRLPASRDRCEDHLWEHGEKDDWKPCDEDETHYGHDFMFVAWLILNDSIGVAIEN